MEVVGIEPNIFLSCKYIVYSICILKMNQKSASKFDALFIMNWGRKGGISHLQSSLIWCEFTYFFIFLSRRSIYFLFMHWVSSLMQFGIKILQTTLIKKYMEIQRKQQKIWKGLHDKWKRIKRFYVFIHASDRLLLFEHFFFFCTSFPCSYSIMFVDELYRLLLTANMLLISGLISFLPLIGPPISFVYFCWIYAFYSFE